MFQIVQIYFHISSAAPATENVPITRKTQFSLGLAKFRNCKLPEKFCAAHVKEHTKIHDPPKFYEDPRSICDKKLILLRFGYVMGRSERAKNSHFESFSQITAIELGTKNWVGYYTY